MGEGSYAKNFRLATVPETDVLVYGGWGGEGGPGAIYYESEWGTSVIRLRTRAPIEPGEDESWYRALSFVPDASGTVGGAEEYRLSVTWRLYRGSLSSTSPALSGKIRVGYDYVPGSWLALPFGIAVSFSAGTIAAAKRAYATLYPAKILPRSYREIDLSREVYDEDGILPEFSIEEVQTGDLLRLNTSGRERRAKRSLLRNVSVSLDAVPVGIRTEILRWIEEGKRVAVFPYYNARTRLLVPFQDSLRSYIGQQPFSHAGQFHPPGTRGYYEDRSGVWRPAAPNAVACYGNMEPLGRGLLLAEGISNGWENLVWPSSPTAEDDLGWTADGENDVLEFDAAVTLPVEGDPGAVRWTVGASSDGLERSFSLASGTAGVFSVWIWGGSSGSVTLEQDPEQSGVPSNSISFQVSSSPRRVFIGVKGASGSVTVRVTADEGSVLFLAAAQGEACRSTTWRSSRSITSCAWHGPTPYQRRLSETGDVSRSHALWSVSNLLPGYFGRISFFWAPNFLGGSSTGGVVGMAASSPYDLLIAMTDADGDGDPEIRASIASGWFDTIEVVTDELEGVDETTVFFVVFTYRILNGIPNLRLEVFWEGNPDGTVATATGQDPRVHVAIDLEAHSFGRWNGRLALLRVDADSHISSPPGTGDEGYWAKRQFDWWTSSETKEIAKILFGREYEISSGEQRPDAGGTLIDLPLSFIERRTDEYAAIYKGRDPGVG